MTIGKSAETPGKRLEGPGIEAVVKKLLIGPADGWDGWTMRLFEIAAGGHTPRHAHPWPHINYVVSGSGTLHLEGVDTPVASGSYAYVPGDARHQFSNAGDDVFAFICIVPSDGDV